MNRKLSAIKAVTVACALLVTLSASATPDKKDKTVGRLLKRKTRS